MTGAWRPLLALLLLLAAGTLRAQEGDAVTDEVVRDREFGVSARHFGLERRVAMYQWRVQGSAYERVWSEAPIDSTGYAPGHDNPAFPLRGRRWLAERATLDDKPLDRSVIEQFGVWRSFRPNFSALPGNLAATFQPEGDGLGSAENPLDPQIGDLRVRWRELRLPPLAGRVEWRGGGWRLRPDAMQARNQEDEVAPGSDGSGALSRTTTWLVGGLMAVMLVVVLLRRHHRRERGNRAKSP
jgi:hypothetical protein